MSLTIDNSTVKQIKHLRQVQEKESLMLRITVEGGGCSGFKYDLALTDITGTDDHVFAECIVTDSISLPFLKGSTIRFEENLTGSEFKIENPNAKSGCGCGTSFAV